MNPIKDLKSVRYARELNLLEQVHLALGSASKLDDFYLILLCLLVDPNAYGFSRAFFLRYDDRTQAFRGLLALGASSAAEHRKYRRAIMEETRQLKHQIDSVNRESGDQRIIQTLYNLRFHSLWINLVQGQDEPGEFNSSFQGVSVSVPDLESGHLLRRMSSATHPKVFSADEACIDGLEDFLVFPLIAGTLASKNSLHGVLVCDMKYESRALDAESLYRFQSLLNHAAVLLDNVELVEQLTSATQHLQELDRLKSDFLSIVSHELRTPLTSIVGFVHLLVAGKVGALMPSQLDLLRRVEGHAVHLHSMVNDILEIAEVESGGILNVQLVSVDPLECLMAVIPKVEARRGARDVPIEPRITSAVPHIRTDGVALERIFYHLLDNAVKFITGAGRVTVEFVRADDQVEIAISDTGIGISPENVKRIFDYFYQVDFRLQRNYGGMGIGLTVVKLLLDATGGSIRVDSTPGRGSRFTLVYPLAEA